MNNTFSENLKKIRKDNHLSQEELAEQLGVSRQAVSKWESSVAYPEMDKIIQICEKFGVNIDDLLHKDIKEVKGEEETKNKVNKYIDDLFRFITDTVRLFENMNFKSKVKCLFEQFVIGTILFIVFGIIYIILSEGIFYNIFHNILPDKVFYIFSGILDSIYFIFGLVCGIIILVHIFNIRYLDYFKSIKDNNKKIVPDNKEDDTEDIKEETNISNLSIDEKNKIIFKKNKEKIIIRDPNHSEYNFLKGLIKLILFGIKFCAIWITLGLCFSLIFIEGFAVASFLIVKTGILFIGVLIGLIALGILNVVLVLLLFNFIFDRKNNKKLIIWSSIISIIIIGASCGLIAIGLLDFNVVDYSDKETVVKSIEIDMNDKMYIDNYMNNSSIEYIVDNTRNNLKLEYDTYEEFEIDYYITGYGNLHVWTECRNPMKVLRMIVHDLNNKKINTYANYSEHSKIRVYASQSNIDLLKTNNKNAYELEKQHEKEIENYEKMIEDYEKVNSEYDERLEEAYSKIESLKDEIEEYKFIIEENNYDE